MDVHKNARLTPRSREWMVKRVRGGEPQAKVAREMGVSVKTVKKWVCRYEREGLGGLVDRSSRPHRSPGRTQESIEIAVLALRRERLIMQRIAHLMEISRATVARVLRRAGLNRLSKLTPVPFYPRYERSEPGELLHLDVKKLGRILGVGHRITGDRRVSVKNAGWEYAHVAIDDHSRVSYAQILPDEQANSACAFLRAAVAYFAALGVRIREVLTDNGPCYHSKEFARTCEQLGLKRRYTRPYTPRTNGKAERFIQTALREWAYARAYNHSSQRISELPHWLHGYNWHRPHASLAGQPPMSRIGLTRNNLVRLHN